MTPSFFNRRTASACMDHITRKWPRILLISDDPYVTDGLAILLTAADYELVEARSGKQGVRIALLEPFDLVITDMVMPEQDGIETILILLARQPDLRIIALGEKVHDLYLAVAQRLGARHTVVKPFSGEEMLDLVQSLVGSETFSANN